MHLENQIVAKGSMEEQIVALQQQLQAKDAEIASLKAQSGKKKGFFARLFGL